MMSSFQSLLQKRVAEGVVSKQHEGRIIEGANTSDASIDSEHDTKRQRLPEVDSPMVPELPHFLILGAQKAGTMAAVLNLNKHPNIKCLKEPHFFDLAWHTKGISWYRNQFQNIMRENRNVTIVGEKTPELIYVDDCAARMKSVCPNAKFLLFLRDPISRAYSAWNMNVSKNRESAPFEECIQRNLNNLDEFRSYGTAEFHYLQRGFYMDQIERFMRCFSDRSRLLIVIAERIRSDPTAEYARIFEFLQVPPPPSNFKAEDDHIGAYFTATNGKNKREAVKMGDRIRDKLRAVYRSHNERLFDFLGFRIHEWETNVDTNSNSSSSSNGSNSSSRKDSSSDSRVDSTMLDNSKAEGTVSNVSADASHCNGNDHSSNSSNSNSNSSARISNSNSNSAVVQTLTRNPSAGSGQSLQLQLANANSSCSASGDFAQLGRKHGTDKITHHGYHRFYPRFLEQYRGLSASAAMLEIGIDQSCSLHMWLEYFPRAFVYGVDISVSSCGNRYKIFRADQSKLYSLREIAQQEITHPLFFILDDGSHIPEHQIACFDYLFGQVLQPGGCYIIEDIETSYWTRSGLYGYQTRYGYHHERSAVEIFKDLLDDVNREFLTEQNREAQEYRVGSEVSLSTRKLISSVTFGQNCVIVTKKSAEEAAYDDRVYRFRKNL